MAALAAVATAIAFVGSLTLTPVAGKIAWKIGAVCRPDGKRKLHARPTPLGGGGAVYLALILSIVACCLLATNAVHDNLPPALALSAGILCLLGFYDDLYDMPARWKLLGQIVATLPVVAAGSYASDLAAFGTSIHVGPLGIPGTVLWLVLGVNALNLLDGVDGLASLVGIVISLAIGAIAATQHRPEVMLLAFVLAGALGGFLVHNLPPARIYLGDCGSMVIGFTLAVLALRVSLSPNAPGTANLAVAAALLFVPLMDVALAVVRRTLRGCSFMVADRGHIHHQLLKRGLSNWQVLGVLGGFGLATGLIAFWVSVFGHELWGWAALGAVTLGLAAGKLIGSEEIDQIRCLVAGRAAAWAKRRSAAARLNPSQPVGESAEPLTLSGPAQPEHAAKEATKVKKAA